ncbi:MAG: Outer membrane protein assembly factor BamB [Verrucomicrobia subdivision 3 bacterium]|nr:Outer membrane protein assembly factor BamB [Limisphaerales bacterium]MCS1415754.1 Outer membrane protein assembly factor BamB [Limisphaerales bacterium]
MISRMCHSFVAFGAVCVASAATDISHANWPQFRGPTGQGISKAENLPIFWCEDVNVGWKTAIHGKAWSSPVAYGDMVWLSTATEDGRRLSGLCVDVMSGAIEFDEVLFQVDKPQFTHKFNSYASPTPVIDGKRVYITFGSEGTVCLDMASKKVLWAREDIECNHFRGAGSSPIIYENLLIMNFDGSDYQFVIALDKYSGRTVWRTKRSVDFQDLDENGLPERDGDWRKGFSTPHVGFFDGVPVLLSLGSMCLYSYEPLSGRELWRVESRVGHSGSTRPTVSYDRIFYCTGFAKGELWCVKPGGVGDVTESHVLWKLKRSVSNKPSLILSKGLIFMIHDGGVASCVEAESGQPIWQERVGGNYSASSLLNDGKIYFFSEEGKTTVISASKEFEVLATNQLDDGFMASPAVIGNSLILRTKSHLYRIIGD